MNCDKYLNSDFRSLELHSLIAKKLEEDPSLVKIAIDNIARWKRQNDFPQPYLDEWLEIINSGQEPLLNFLRSPTEKGQRLRSSSPFVGIMTQQERNEIFEKYKKISEKDCSLANVSKF